MKNLLNILMKYQTAIVSLIVCTFCIIIDLHGNEIMAIFKLQFRPWVLKAFFFGFLIFKYVFLVSLSVKFGKWFYSKYIQKPSLLKRIVAMFVFFLILCMIGWELFILSMTPKEYIVNRDSKKCVACVTSWNDSSVECHEYKGLFLMGEDTVSYEIYHRTSDPFESGLAPFEK